MTGRFQPRRAPELGWLVHRLADFVDEPIPAAPRSRTLVAQSERGGPARRYATSRGACASPAYVLQG